ncbi:hypothetical protein Tco_1088183 [Tanacetum coccineum]
MLCMIMEYAPVKLKLRPASKNSSSPTDIVAVGVVTSETTRVGTAGMMVKLVKNRMTTRMRVVSEQGDVIALGSCATHLQPLRELGIARVAKWIVRGVRRPSRRVGVRVEWIIFTVGESLRVKMRERGEIYCEFDPFV